MEEEIQSGAVLLSDQIERYIKEYDLISPFNEKNLKTASYQLSVGNEYAIGGELKKLNGKGDVIKIDPFNVAIIQTLEEIKMPKDLIARWNIRVSLAYKGLLWVGGPQVDPGYNGHLYCPIYNLSDQPVELSIEEKLATIDFTKTTKHNENVKPFLKTRKSIEDYNYGLESGLFTEVGKKINVFSERLNSNEKNIDSKFEEMENNLFKSIQEISCRLDNYIFGFLTLIGIIITVIAVLISFAAGNDFSIPFYSTISLILSYICLMGLIFTHTEFKYKRKK